MSSQTAQLHYAVFCYGMSKRIDWYAAACGHCLSPVFKKGKEQQLGQRMVHIEKQSLPPITLRCLVTGNTFADLKFSFWTCTLLKAIHLYD